MVGLHEGATAGLASCRCLCCCARYLLITNLCFLVSLLQTQVKTGSGLPAGPGGILGAAEGLGFLAVLAGVVVLGFQIADYGYIPNAVPEEGAKCS